MAHGTFDPIRDERRFQNLLLVLFVLGIGLICLLSYTTRSFLTVTIPGSTPSAFGALTPPAPGVLPQAAPTGNLLRTGGARAIPTASGRPSNIDQRSAGSRYRKFCRRQADG